MNLTFDAKLVRQLLENSLAAPERRPSFEGETDAGLWLVADTGIYLMSNSTASPLHPDAKPGETRLLVAYADQVNPETLPVEEWMRNKEASVGPDDGVVLLEAEYIEEALAKAKEGKIMLVVTEEEIAF